MRAILLLIPSVVLLFLTAAFASVLWNGRGVLLTDYQVYLFEGVGFALYFVVRVLFVFLHRNLNFAETFCHELNHTFFAVLCFHKVESFFAHAKNGGRVTFDGGLNPIIALAPYSFPLFAFILSLLSLILIPQARLVVQGFVGFFIAFHLMSVWHEARPRQTDLQLYGYLFSYSAIIFSNVFWVPFTARLCALGVSSAWLWTKSGFFVVWNWVFNGSFA